MTQDRAVIVGQVKRLICEIFSAEEDRLDDDTPIRGLEGWESLKHMEFIVRLQDILQIELTADDIAGLRSVASIRHILNSRKAA